MLLATASGLSHSVDRPHARALAFLAGVLGALGLLVVVVFSALGPAIVGALRSSRSIVAAIDMALGSGLLVLGAIVALRAPRGAPRRPAPRSLRRDVALGVVLQGRDVRAMTLAYACLQHVALAGVGPATKIVATVVAVTIISLPAWLPLLVQLSVPKGLEQRFARVRQAALAHRQAVAVAVCLVFGTFLVVRGALGQ